MIKRLLCLVALLCITSLVSADGCSEAPMWTKSLTPTVPKFMLDNKLTYTDVKIVYVSSSTADVGVSVSVCTDDAAQKSALQFSLSSSSDSVVLSATSSYKGAGQISPTSSASKTGPLSTFLVIAFGLLVTFRPKNQISMVVLLAIGLVYVAHAASTVSITITISIPDSITTICEGSVCGGRDAGAVSSYVTLYGGRYSTLDVLYGGKCDASAVMKLPTNWKIVDTKTDSNALYAIAFNDWKTTGVIVADGSVYANHQYNSKTGSAGFTSSADGYKVASCDTKILIAQYFPLNANNTITAVNDIAITKYVTFNGYDYAAADNTAYDATTVGAQSVGVYVTASSGWEVVPEEDSTQVFIKSTLTSIFGAECLVLKSGNAFTPAFSACGTNMLVSATRGDGFIYGVASGKSRVLVRRASTAANTIPASMSITHVHAKVTNAATNAGVTYAVLDNADPYDVSASGCQDRFYALPAGSDWHMASDSELYNFLLTNKPADGNVWVNTSCFVNAASQYDRDLKSCTAKMVTKTVNGVTFYGTDSCARILLVGTYAAKTDFTVGMKLLLIAATSEPNVTVAWDGAMRGLAQTVFNAVGLPYDTIYLSDPTGKVTYPGSLPLYDEQGNGKYYAIVMTSLNPLIVVGSSQKEAFTATQRAQLNYYKFLYSVRMVTLNDFWQANTQGVSAIYGTATAGQCVSLDTSFRTSAAKYLSGVVPSANFDVSNQYYAAVTLPTTATPVLRLVASDTATPASSDKIVAAIIVNTDKTEEFQFYTGNAEYLDHGPVLANIWLSWVTRNLWIGNRRVYFSPQIDDLFLTTGQYGNEAVSVRMTGDDMRKTHEFLVTLNTLAPNTSRITLTYGANCIEADTADKDDLVKATQELEDYFFWESHTWSHLDLTCNPEDDPNCHNTTYDETMLELTKNDDWIVANVFPAKGLDTPNWSRNSMITPAITGLFNAEALHALYDYGMRCVVGDNSRPAELLPENPYLGMWSTVEHNNFAGIFIIPRYATEVYYNAATPAVLLHEYNDRYGPQGSGFFKQNSTLDELMQREGENNFRHLAVFRHDPYMFHQCNLAHFDYVYAGDATKTSKKWSMVTLWLQTVVDRYNKMLNFPFIGVKQQDLRDVYFARREREFCGLDGKLTVTAGNSASVSISSTASCTASITGLNSCTGSTSDCRTESYALDTTVWAPMTANHSTTLTTPANSKWNF